MEVDGPYYHQLAQPGSIYVWYSTIVAWSTYTINQHNAEMGIMQSENALIICLHFSAVRTPGGVVVPDLAHSRQLSRLSDPANQGVVTGYFAGFATYYRKRLPGREIAEKCEIAHRSRGHKTSSNACIWGFVGAPLMS